MCVRLKAVQLGSGQGNGDSGYQGRPGQKGHLCFGTGALGSAGSHIRCVIVRADVLCMQRTLKIMSFPSKARARARERESLRLRRFKRPPSNYCLPGTAFKFFFPILPTYSVALQVVVLLCGLQLTLTVTCV